MSDNWRSEPATEQQIEKLRFFGCTWDEGITAGQASDALEECARQFPQVETAWRNRPDQALTIAPTFPPEPKRDDPKYQKSLNPARQNYLFELAHLRWEESVARSKTEKVPAQIQPRAKNQDVVKQPEPFPEPPNQPKPPAEQFDEQIMECPARVESLCPPERTAIDPRFPPEPKRSDPKYQAWINPAGQEYGFELDHLRWEQTVERIKTEKKSRTNSTVR